MFYKLLTILCVFLITIGNARAQDGPSNAYFDSVATKIHVKSYTVAKQKIEELSFKKRITYYNPQTFLNPYDSSWTDTFFTQEVNASSTLIRVNGKIYESISTEEIQKDFPASLVDLKKAFVLPDGKLGLLVYDAQMGHSRGDCGKSSRISVEIFAIDKNYIKSIFSILYGSCDAGVMHVEGLFKNAEGNNDSSMSFIPAKFRWEKKKLIMDNAEKSNNPSNPGGTKSLEFIKEKNGVLVRMNDEK